MFGADTISESSMPPHPVSSAEQGRALALALDLRLRHEELRERESLLGESSGDGEGAVAPAPSPPDLTLRQLETENRLLREFHSAVLHSRSWRALQFVRSLIGRRW